MSAADRGVAIERARYPDDGFRWIRLWGLIAEDSYGAIAPQFQDYWLSTGIGISQFGFMPIVRLLDVWGQPA